MTNNKEATRYYSNKQEQSVCKALGGVQTSNSGAARFSAGDVIVKDASMLIECKCSMTEKQSISLKKEWFIKNKDEAFATRLINNCVCVNGLSIGEIINIYNLEGQLVHHEVATDSTMAINCIPGIYVINIGNQSIKVCVR